MKFVSSAQARADLSELAIEAQDIPIVVLRHGNPHVLLTGVAGARVGELHDVSFTAFKIARDNFFSLAEGAQEKSAVILKFEEPFVMLVGLDGKTIEEVMKEQDRDKKYRSIRTARWKARARRAVVARRRSRARRLAILKARLSKKS